MNQDQAIVISDSVPEVVEVLDSQDVCTSDRRLPETLSIQILDNSNNNNNIQDKTHEEDLITPTLIVVDRNVEEKSNNNDNLDEDLNHSVSSNQATLEKSFVEQEEDVIMLDDFTPNTVLSQQEDTGFESDEEEEEEPSIIPDQTVSTCIVSLINDEESGTTEMVNLLEAPTPTLKTPTPQPESIRTFKKTSTSGNVTEKSTDKESNISISFVNVSHKLIEKIQKLLDEEYISTYSHSKKGRRRETTTLCSGLIEANPHFVTEKINFDGNYLKNLKIDIEKPNVEEKPANANKVCFNCLGVGHIIRDCPYEIDYEQIEKNKESFKSNNSRFYEVIDPKYKRSNDRSTSRNNALEMGYFAEKLSKRTRRKLPPSELESYKCSTPENKIHTNDVGKVSDEFLYGGTLPSDYSGRKEQLNKVFTKLKEHKESEKKRKFDQVEIENEDEYIHVNVSQKSNQNKFNKNKKYKGSYNNSHNQQDRENNRDKNYISNRRYQDNDRYQEDRYHRYNHSNRRYDDEEEYSQRNYNYKDRKNKNSNKKNSWAFDEY